MSSRVLPKGFWSDAMSGKGRGSETASCWPRSRWGYRAARHSETQSSAGETRRDWPRPPDSLLSTRWVWVVRWDALMRDELLGERWPGAGRDSWWWGKARGRGNWALPARADPTSPRRSLRCWTCDPVSSHSPVPSSINSRSWGPTPAQYHLDSWHLHPGLPLNNPIYLSIICYITKTLSVPHIIS